MTQTTNLGLNKQGGAEFPLVSADNENWDKLDEEVAARAKSVNGTTVDANGDIDLPVVPFAENLETSASQTSAGTFVSRSTGGASSVDNGDGWLTLIRGNKVHTGYVAESLNMTVTPITRQEGESPITATIDRDTWVAQVSTSGTTTFTYTTAWNLDPATYGITVTGTPIAGDQIVVVYVKEERGTITMSDPQSFVSTGWNLYDHSKGYARVCKYSETYGFEIDGAYTALQFSETLTGEKTTITPTSGYFSVPSDGYVWVTGGNSTTTQIWMTWTDWIGEANDGVFAAYSETTIDLSDIMDDYFPYGLMAVGSYVDEINLNVGTVTQNVERKAYNAANLAAAIASGRDYEYDEDYIYIGLAEPVTDTIEIDGSYTANDHGMELFPDSPIGVYAQTLYGANLKNKLERDVLTISQQTLSSAEKSQVQSNLGLVPTQATNITGAGYVADARAIKSLNDHMATNTIGTSLTLDGLKTAIVNKLTSIAEGSFVNIGFAMASGQGVATGTYRGTISKIIDTYGVAYVYSQYGTDSYIIGIKNNVCTVRALESKELWTGTHTPTSTLTVSGLSLYKKVSIYTNDGSAFTFDITGGTDIGGFVSNDIYVVQFMKVTISGNVITFNEIEQFNHNGNAGATSTITRYDSSSTTITKVIGIA